MSIYTPSNAYITATGEFLPGEVIDNDHMEAVLGLVNDQPSRFRRRILQSNGIKQRHYALDASGQPTHMTEELAALAIQQAISYASITLEDVQMLSVGTTIPDLLAPGIASMVHGRIKGGPMDILSCAGICGSGAAAFKAAAMSVISGQHKAAISCGTERPSVIMQGKRFSKESTLDRTDSRLSETYNYFSADFLRWMLSDGAGAFVIQDTPNDGRPSLKIEWIETTSYAHELPTCMYMGTTNPNQPGIGNTWLHQDSLGEVDNLGLLLLRQDTKLLGENIVRIVTDFAKTLAKQGKLIADEVDWFLPHISSFFFQEKLFDAYAEQGIPIAKEKWFTNLETKGNTGAASMYIMLHALLYSDQIKKGEKVVMMIPESARFSVTYAQLTVV
ncbi:3-oxoacyl-[acyl-carrier-protein] synthase-3 [Sinobacterium caligoides]|uniref:3-oxoacyl-[acyl-carrier-protein] synthase-3 n=1 Tax=Sinobacterium caligoides TaxID=933926 RepID=A0A3N2D5Z8_9GAMM|nr:3-oxoacyl-[acyl-carrier-protein] synthase III C-terminal domain-containing protein [Sinobacterium caligoides]ROR94904.1 3-oxoacyl-[acyl-carrier-protein] synthase-3 [Sinobacterium caligoides]